MLNPSLITKQTITAVKSGELHRLPRLMQSAVRRGREEFTPLGRIEAYYSAALMHYISGANREVLRLREQIHAESNSGGSDWLNAANRLAVRALLNAGDYKAAEAIADETDALILFNSGQDVITRRHEDVHPETWILYGQIFLALGEIEKAENSILNAGQAVLREKQIIFQIRTPSRRRQAEDSFREIEAEYELMDNLLKFEQEDSTAGDYLVQLYQRTANECYSKQLRGRVAAACGAWRASHGEPPFGLPLAEALRFAALGGYYQNDSNDQMTVSTVSEESQALLPTAFASPVEFKPDFQQLFGELARSVALAVKEQSSADRFGQNRQISEGFSFERLDILNQLAIAEQQLPPFTGFFHLRWNPEMIKTSVLAKKINAAVLCGEAFIFMVAGWITDATLGDYDAPQFASEEEARKDARATMNILLRLGIGYDLDDTADGFMVSYKSPAVAERKPRLRMQQIHLSALLVEIETGADRKELNNPPSAPVIPATTAPSGKTVDNIANDEDILDF